MILSYSFILLYIYSNYNRNTSISGILCDDKCKFNIIKLLGIFGVFTLCYEFVKKDFISFSLILFLLIFIYKLILIDENNIIHYIYTSFVCLIILVFMCYNCLNFNNDYSIFIYYFIFNY